MSEPVPELKKYVLEVLASVPFRVVGKRLALGASPREAMASELLWLLSLPGTDKYCVVYIYEALVRVAFPGGVTGATVRAAMEQAVQ